jgi:protein SCO1
MKTLHRTLPILLLVASAAPAMGQPAMPQPGRPTPGMPAQVVTTETFREIGFDQNLGAQVPLDLAFRDESGRPVRLAELMRGRPTILTLVYYECPMLCNEVLNSLLRSLNALSFDVGDQFDVITVSIDPGESPKLAAHKKALYLERYNRKGAERGWHFLTGPQSSIDRLAKAVGFRYAYDAPSDQYAHAAGIMLLTPEGKIARYYFGISYPAKDLRLGLIEASDGKVGSPIDQILLLCYHYDPKTGKYNLAIMRILQVLGCATAASLGTFMLVMLRRDRTRPGPSALAPREARQADPPLPPGDVP